MTLGPTKEQQCRRHPPSSSPGSTGATQYSVDHEAIKQAHTLSASYAGLTRGSITLRKSLSKLMDARVKPAHDEVCFGTAPALQRTASRCAASGERRAQTKKPALPPAFVRVTPLARRVGSMRG